MRLGKKWGRTSGARALDASKPAWPISGEVDGRSDAGRIETGTRISTMDLGISGKKAIVCAASKGLGRGCAESLAREGVDVTICARSEGPLNETAEAIRAAGQKHRPG